MNWLHQVALTLLVVSCLSKSTTTANKITNITQAQQALDEYNQKAEEVTYKAVAASWDYYTNLTDYNQEKMLAEDLVSATFSQESATNLSRFDTNVMVDPMKREFLKILDIGTAAQTDTVKLARLNKVQSDMSTIYSTAKACLSPTECLPLDPDLTQLLTKSRDYDRLLKAWVGWRDASGKKMKNLYTEFVSLSNEALAILNYTDTGAYWRADYEMDGFEDEVKRLFDQLLPLYQHLHAYVRNKLKEIYGAYKFPSTGHIPAHLLGNMWAQQWTSLTDELMPYKGKPSMDVTDEMVRQNYTALKIFQKADEFFESLGMIPMPQEFWDKSMLVKPADREVVCHASAWDFYNRKDFRIKQCTEVTQDDFETAHHEMGHVEYYLHVKNLPVDFRRAANPGFHEAVGDTISLSVQTPEHMQSIGLLSNIGNDKESDINFLMNMALSKIAFLPFGYLIDQWRWSVFRGDTTPEKYNEDWWNLRCKYQGVSPPVERSSDDFDPGAKYHIPGNTPYIRYFVSNVIQFQFHQAACKAAGYNGPLHRCDIYNNTNAGKALGDMLALGSSKPWPEAMQQLTGQRSMSAEPLMEYFAPLLEFLRAENGDDIGWKDACPTFGTANMSSVPSMTLVSCVLVLSSLVKTMIGV